MNIYKERIDSYELTEIIHKSDLKMNEIKLKLDNDDLIDQGLFLMATTYFEATLRDVMYQILTVCPEKLKSDKFSINKDVLCSVGDKVILCEIIENELFNLFKGNVKDQLLYIVEMVSNIKQANIERKPGNEGIMNVVTRCSDISIYRNSLIHNAGIAAKDFPSKISVYEHNINERISFNKELIVKFIDDYMDFFNILKEKINKNVEFSRKTRIEQLRNLWNQCYNSPLLRFDEYWVIDEERDLVTDIKHSEYEGNLSSSERIYLSIWRHQFFDRVPTEEFLLCSINEDIVYKIYKGLDKLKFYHMYQIAHPLK